MTSLKQARKRLEQDQDVAGKAMQKLAEANDLASHADFEFAADRYDTLGRRIKSLKKAERKAELRNIREPGPYDPGSPNSFILDRLVVRSPLLVSGVDPSAAQRRLEQHSAGTSHHTSTRDAVAYRSLSRYGVEVVDGGMIATEGSGVISQRALAAEVSGLGAEFVPPVYQTDLFVTVARGAAPILRLAARVDMPSTGLAFYRPRLNFAPGVRPAQENTDAPDGWDDTTDQIEAPAVMLTGQATISYALLERSPRGASFDSIVVADAAQSMASQLEQLLLTGAGGSTILGLLNVPNINSVTYTDASPTPGKLVQSVAQGAAQVGDNRLLAPEAVLVRPSRYYWGSGSVDGNGDPVQRPGTGYFNQKAPADGPFGPWAGLPVYLDAAIPSNLGSGADQDGAVVFRPSDLLILTSEPRFDVLMDSSGSGSSLAAYVQWRIYVAAFTNSFPSGISLVTGTGWVVPSGW